MSSDGMVEWPCAARWTHRTRQHPEPLPRTLLNREPRGRWQVKRPPKHNLQFDSKEYANHLKTSPNAHRLVSKCRMEVMANVVRDSLPEYSRRQYKKIYDHENIK